MVGLDRVVGVLLDVVPGRRCQVVELGRVNRCAVGDYLGRDHLERTESRGEESAGRRGIAVGGEPHVDDLAVLVDRPVEVRLLIPNTEGACGTGRRWNFGGVGTLRPGARLRLMSKLRPVMSHRLAAAVRIAAAFTELARVI